MSELKLTELPSIGQTIRMAMRLDPSIYRAIQVAPHGIWVAIFIVSMASISEALGQSVVLFINRVRPRRYLLALGISTASNMIAYLLWTAVIWLMGAFFYGLNFPFIAIASAVGLAYAPQLLAFFELVPFLGNPFGIILSLWSMLAIAVAIYVGLNFTFWQALIASAVGWLLIQVFRRTIGIPVYALGHWIQDRAAGAPLRFNVKDIPRLRRSPRLLENVEIWRDLLSRAKWEELMENMRIEANAKLTEANAKLRERSKAPKEQPSPSTQEPPLVHPLTTSGVTLQPPAQEQDRDEESEGEDAHA
jgi:hypothetical protein